jgi:hypothetical protein
MVGVASTACAHATQDGLDPTVRCLLAFVTALDTGRVRCLPRTGSGDPLPKRFANAILAGEGLDVSFPLAQGQPVLMAAPCAAARGAWSATVTVHVPRMAYASALHRGKEMHASSLDAGLTDVAHTAVVFKQALRASLHVDAKRDGAVPTAA